MWTGVPLRGSEAGRGGGQRVTQCVEGAVPPQEKKELVAEPWSACEAWLGGDVQEFPQAELDF